MKFTKNLHNQSVDFETTEETEKHICFEVTLPAHGGYLRQIVFSVSDLNQIILEQLKMPNLIPELKSGLTKTKKNTTTKMCLKFQKNLSSKKNSPPIPKKKQKITK